MGKESLYPRFKFYSFNACILYQVVLFFITAYYSCYLGFTNVPDKIDSLVNCIVALMLLLSTVLITIRSKVWFLLVGVSSMVSLLAVLALALWKMLNPERPDAIKILMLVPLMLLVAVEISLTFVSKFTRHHEARVVLRDGEQKILLSHLVMMILIVLFCCVATALVWQNVFDLSLTIYVLVNSALNIKLLHYYLLPRKFSLLRLISSCCFTCFRLADARHDAAVNKARHGSITYMHYEGGNRKAEIAKARAEKENDANWAFCFSICFLFASFLILAFPALFAVIFAFAYQSRLTQLSYAQMWVCIPAFVYMITTTIATYTYNKKRDDDDIADYYEDTTAEKKPKGGVDDTDQSSGVPNTAPQTDTAGDSSVAYIPAPVEAPGVINLQKNDVEMQPLGLPAQQQEPQQMAQQYGLQDQAQVVVMMPGKVDAPTTQESGYTVPEGLSLPHNGEDETMGYIVPDTTPDLPSNY